MKLITSILKCIFATVGMVIVTAPKLPILILLMMADVGGHPKAGLWFGKVFVWPFAEVEERRDSEKRPT